MKAGDKSRICKTRTFTLTTSHHEGSLREAQSRQVFWLSRPPPAFPFPRGKSGLVW
jgi:hypothetical protein